MSWTYLVYNLLPSLLLGVDQLPVLKDWGAGGTFGPQEPFGPIERHLYTVTILLYPVVMFFLIMIAIVFVSQLILKIFGLPTIWEIRAKKRKEEREKREAQKQT